MNTNRVIMSMTEILNNLFKLKNQMNETIEKGNLSNDSRLLLTLYNPNRNTTIGGVSVEDATIDLTVRYDGIFNLITLYTSLLEIKESVNSRYTLEVPDMITGELTTLTISTILTYKSKPVKDYFLKLIEKINRDKTQIVDALESHQTNVMSQDRIDQYVNAKFTSLKMNSMDDMKSANYKTFAEEYINANKLDILDPNNIKDWNKIESNIKKFYSTVDYKLLEFNSTTKLWLDITDNGSIKNWGMCE